MQIAERDEQSKKAPNSIDNSLDSDSKITLERHRQLSKQRSPTDSTDGGMQIDESE
jgi:hypothetical protein